MFKSIKEFFFGKPAEQEKSVPYKMESPVVNPPELAKAPPSAPVTEAKKPAVQSAATVPAKVTPKAKSSKKTASAPKVKTPKVDSAQTTEKPRKARKPKAAA